MLENMKQAVKPQVPKDYRPGIDFDGTEGTATTHGYEAEP